jgi:hypothetical protein
VSLPPDVWDQASRFEGRSQVTTWILSIARFKTLSALKAHSDETLIKAIAAGDRVWLSAGLRALLRSPWTPPRRHSRDTVREIGGKFVTHPKFLGRKVPAGVRVGCWLRAPSRYSKARRGRLAQNRVSIPRQSRGFNLVPPPENLWAI